MLSESTQRKEDSSKKWTPERSKKLDDFEIKKEFFPLEKSNKKNDEKFQMAYKKLIVKSILFNFEYILAKFSKNWFDDTRKDLKKLQATFKKTDYIENVLMLTFLTIIDFLKGNIKNFCHYLDNILVKIDKINPELFNMVIK